MAETAKTQNTNLAYTVRANVVINLIRTLTMTILSFITFPYVARVLSDQTFGLYTWANTFVYYFVILSKISIPNLAIRECAKVKDDPVAFSHKVQEFFLLQAIMTVISFALMCAAVFSVPDLYTAKEIIFLLSINFLVGAFAFEWVYIALEKHFYITVRTILATAFAAMMTFLFVKDSSYHEDYLYIYALIAISGTIITAVSNSILLPRYVSFKKTAPYNFRPLLKTLVTMALISFSLTLYNQTDEFLLGFIDPTKASVGAYSVGVKGIDIVITLITSLYMVFMPRASYYYEKADKRFFQNLINYSLNITFFIAVPAIATMSTLATPVTSLISGSDFTATYKDANLVLPILSIMMLTYSICDNIYTEILLPMKREKIYLYAMLIGVVCNVMLSLLLGIFAFPEHPALGVAIATGSTDVVLVAFLIWKSWQYSRSAIFNWNNLKIIAMGLVIGILTFFLSPVILKALPFSGDTLWIGYILDLLICVAGDAIIYVIGLLLLKEKLVSSFLPSHRKEAQQNNG